WGLVIGLVAPTAGGEPSPLGPTTRPSAADVAGAELVLAKPGRAYLQGERVVLGVGLTNTGSGELAFPMRRGDAEVGWIVRVTRDGKAAKLTELGRRLYGRPPGIERLSVEIRRIPSGGTAAAEVDVTKVFDLREEGAYEVTVIVYVAARAGGEALVELGSNVVTVKVRSRVVD
ncbi:MAG TPA: hypothetical protein VEA69_22440, partial [Tepidisphaeraceae bacterium]|nr:hypothetical protein [Tepidisphaeraceae bacterium]